MDWLIDTAGKHTVSFRGTLSNNGEVKNTWRSFRVRRLRRSSYPITADLEFVTLLC